MEEYTKKVYVLGGGTVSHVRSHLAISAPAYGSTAKTLALLCMDSPHMPGLEVRLELTKMAGGRLGETNDDVELFLRDVLDDVATKIIFFNVAMCDFEGYTGLEPSGKYATRLKSRDSSHIPIIGLRPARKVISKIRKTRKDITLVGFKTTCGATEQEQYLAGLNLLKESSCNLVLANDVKTRLNMVITPEEAKYHVTTDRLEALRGVVEMAGMRSHLTFTRSTVVAGEPIPWDSELVPATLRQVVDHCIKEGAYKPFRGATVGHFACRIGPTTFLTSRRKTNFNDLSKLGLVKVETDGPDSVIAYGHKPSVGGQSQRIIFDDHPDHDCIVHFHCPLKQVNWGIPVVSQREYECGSHECGKNTSNGMKVFHIAPSSSPRAKIFAVHLDNHGPNILFSSKTNVEDLVEFIDENFNLQEKTGGPVS